MTRILTIALAAIFTMSVNANAEKPAGEKGAGKPGQRGDRAGQRAGGPQGAGRSPEQMVTQMMSEFDKDGDQKLDVAELTALFTSMRERRAQGAAGRGGQAGKEGAARRRPGAAGQGDAARQPRAAGQGGRRGKPGAEQEKAGGERPKRPDTE